VEGSTFTITTGSVRRGSWIAHHQSAELGHFGRWRNYQVARGRHDEDGNDSIAIRSLVHLTLGYDHRLIDGAVADQFMANQENARELERRSRMTSGHGLDHVAKRHRQCAAGP